MNLKMNVKKLIGSKISNNSNEFRSVGEITDAKLKRDGIYIKARLDRNFIQENFEFLEKIVPLEELDWNMFFQFNLPDIKNRVYKFSSKVLDMLNKLSSSILEMYNSITKSQEVDIANLAEKFAKCKINEPLACSSSSKIWPSFKDGISIDGHILEDNLIEVKIEDIINNRYGK